MFRHAPNSSSFSGNRFHGKLILCAFVLLASAVSAIGQGTDETEKAIEAFTRGQDAHAKGELTTAIGLYKEAVAIIEKFPEAEYQLGVAYRQSGQLDQSERSFRRAVEFRDDWSLALSGLGAILVERSKYEEAEPHLIKAIESDDRNFPAYSALVELKVRSKAGKDELNILLPKIRELTEKANPPASIFVARGIVEHALGDSRSAANSFTRARAIEPQNVAAIRELAFVAISNGDIERGRAFVGELERAAPKDRALPILNANILLLDGKNAEADALLEKITEPSPDVVALRKKIADSSTSNINELEERLKSDPNNAVAAGRLCVLYRTLDAARALEFCRRASELEPNNINPAIGFASALIRAQNFTQAVALLKRLAEVQPENSTIRANLASAYFHSKAYPDAKREFKWLADNQPENSITYYFLGIVHDNLGEYLDAAARYQEFLRKADPAVNQLEIDKVNLRMPTLQRQIKNKKGR